jgi:hypothetical protein
LQEQFLGAKYEDLQVEGGLGDSLVTLVLTQARFVLMASLNFI